MNYLTFLIGLPALNPNPDQYTFNPQYNPDQYTFNPQYNQENRLFT